MSQKRVPVVDRRRHRVGVITFRDIDRDEFRALRSSSRVFYFVLLTYTNQTTSKAWPTMATLGRVTGYGHTTLWKARTQLVEAGFLHCTESARDARRIIFEIRSPGEDYEDG